MTTPVVAARPGAAQRLARVVQVPTVSATATDGRDIRRLMALLAESYPLTFEAAEREEPTDTSLLLRWRGRDAAAAPIVLMAHLDVVPADAEAWHYPPFSGRIAGGWVHGRGALDDKGPLVVLLEAVENLIAAGFVPARDVYLSFGGDEEVLGASARRAAGMLRERGVVPWLVLDEGGAVVPAPLPLLRGRAAMIGVAEKGIATVRLTARSDAGHASTPPPRTAVSRVARAVARLTPGTFAPRVPPALRRMLRLLADDATGLPRALYRALAAAPAATGHLFALLGGEPAALVRTTVAATLQDGGSAANVLPAHASATLNVRIAVGETIAATVERIRRRIADPLVEVTVLDGDEPSPESPVGDARWRLLEAALRESHPDAAAVPYVVMAATDARHFHRIAPAVYRFAPLAMSAAQRASIHGVDERVAVSELERGELFYRTLLQRLQ